MRTLKDCGHHAWDGLYCRICGKDQWGVSKTATLYQRLESMHSVIGEVEDEITRAVKIYKPLNSPHEAAAVIKEEYDEFWDEVKTYNLKRGRDTRPRMREELIQLAAMAIRAITDVIDNGRSEGELNGATDQTPIQNA
jgi:hypothetical protein